MAKVNNQKLWLELKRKGKATIIVPSEILNPEVPTIKKILKSLTRIKGNDSEFNREHPYSRLKSELLKDSQNNHYLQICLTNYIMGNLDAI